MGCLHAWSHREATCVCVFPHQEPGSHGQVAREGLVCGGGSLGWLHERCGTKLRVTLSVTAWRHLQQHSRKWVTSYFWMALGYCQKLSGDLSWLGRSWFKADKSQNQQTISIWQSVEAHLFDISRIKVWTWGVLCSKEFNSNMLFSVMWLKIKLLDNFSEEMFLTISVNIWWNFLWFF